MSHSNAETAPGPIRVLHLTDLHLTGDPASVVMGVPTEPSFKAVLAALHNEPSPDLLLLTGDLTHDDPRGLERLRLLLDAPLKCPALLTAGNHDDSRALESATLPGDWQANASLSVGNWHILTVDTSIPGRVHGHLPGPTLDRIEQAARKHSDAYILLALHHPPVSVGTAWLDRIALDNGAELLARLEALTNIRAIVFGHAHQAFDSRQGKLKLLGTPSTCAQFLPGASDFALDTNASPGGRWLDLYSDGRIDTEVFRVPFTSVRQ